MVGSVLAGAAHALAGALEAALGASLDRFTTGALVAVLRWLLEHLAPLLASAPTVSPTSAVVLGPYEHVAALAGALLLPGLLVVGV